MYELIITDCDGKVTDKFRTNDLIILQKVLNFIREESSKINVL